MKLPLIIIFALTIYWCSANDSILCQQYTEKLKFLQIICDQNSQEWYQNCTHDAASSSNVIHLKVVHCDANVLLNISQTYQNVQRLDILFADYPTINWTGIAFNNVNELNLPFNGLTTIPTELIEKLPKLTTLNLPNNQLTNISSADFQHIPKTTEINLFNNHLNLIDANAFASLPNLKSLNLQNNRFTTIPMLEKLAATEINFQENLPLTTFDCRLISTIRGPSSWLNLTWHHITTFRGDQNCRKRKIIDIKVRDGDGVHVMPSGIELTFSNNQSLQNIRTFVAGDWSFVDVRQMFKFLGSSLQIMDLSGNNVYDLSATMLEQFPMLNELILSDTALKALDFSAFNRNSQLIRLDISNNGLTRVKNADQLSSLQNLTDLNAVGNRIQNAHEMFQNLTPRMLRLNLAGNHIGNTYSSKTFGRLVALEYLNLSNTDLWILNVNPFITLQNLITLDVSNSKLHMAETAFAISPKLRELHVADSQITNPSEIIRNLGASMQVLDLSDNNIGSMLDLTSTQALGNLTHLNLSKTHLQNVDLKKIVPLSELHTLDLSNNRLHRIDLKALKNLTHLNRLYLNGNDLTSLDSAALNAYPNISIAISRNQLSCMFLKKLKRESPHLKFIDNQLDQKHGEDCLESWQAIGDFLGSVYNKVKFW